MGNTSATILGIAQDGGVPHPGCYCKTCERYSKNNMKLSPTSLGIKDGEQFHLVDVSRDLDRQLRIIGIQTVTDIWLTHGHLGHIDGLGLFGKEVMNSKGIRLHASYSMMKLIQNTPNLKKMIDNGIFVPCEFNSNEAIQSSDTLTITPIQVPHRDEFTDTHGFIFEGPTKSLFHLPDHDSWKETLEMVGNENIHDWFSSLNIEIILLDGTFWSKNELSRQKDVPHPPILESLELLGNKKEQNYDIYFIHINHTNPLLNPNSNEIRILNDSGWKLSKEGDEFPL